MRSLIKIVLILFLTVTSQANEDIKKVEDDIKKAANQIADTLKITSSGKYAIKVT